MSDSPSNLNRTFGLGMAVLLGLLGFIYLLAVAELKKQQKLHIPLPVLGQIADFTLTNENSQAVTLADLTNHVWLADIVFTRCAGPCPRMTGQMKGLQDLIPSTSTARLVTLTTDPEYDTPAIFQRYAAKYQADTNRWMFLTGTKKEIANLASGSLKLSAVPVASADQKGEFDLFIHTTIFVIVDKHARLRGVFESGGDGVDWNVVRSHILSTIHQLENES